MEIVADRRPIRDYRRTFQGTGEGADAPGQAQHARRRPPGCSGDTGRGLGDAESPSTRSTRSPIDAIQLPHGAELPRLLLA